MAAGKLSAPVGLRGDWQDVDDAVQALFARKVHGKAVLQRGLTLWTRTHAPRRRWAVRRGGRNGPMDVLAEVLRVSGARGALGVMLKAGGTWGCGWTPLQERHCTWCPAAPCGSTSQAEEPLQVQAGDAILVSPGAATDCRRRRRDDGFLRP